MPTTFSFVSYVGVNHVEFEQKVMSPASFFGYRRRCCGRLSPPCLHLTRSKLSYFHLAVALVRAETNLSYESIQCLHVFSLPVVLHFSCVCIDAPSVSGSRFTPFGTRGRVFRGGVKSTQDFLFFVHLHASTLVRDGCIAHSSPSENPPPPKKLTILVRPTPVCLSGA